MRIRQLLFVSAALVAVTAAHAQARSFYVSAMGGANWLTDETNSNPVEGSDLGGNWRFNTGWDAGGSVGIAFGNGPRIEGEVVYRHNGVDSHFDGDEGVYRSGHGNVSQVSVMVNAAYDVDCGSRWIPYFGIGAGAIHVSYNKAGSFDEDDDDYVIDDSYWRGAVQAFAGVDYPITPTLRLGVRYNYLHADTAQERLNSFVNGSPLTWSRLDDVNDHTVFATLQYTFTPAP